MLNQSNYIGTSVHCFCPIIEHVFSDSFSNHSASAFQWSHQNPNHMIVNNKLVKNPGMIFP